MINLIIKVRCPKCSHIQNTTTVKTVKCFRCNRSFQVYLKDRKGHLKKSRIISIEKGTQQDLDKLVFSELLRNKRDD